MRQPRRMKWATRTLIAGLCHMLLMVLVLVQASSARAQGAPDQDTPYLFTVLRNGSPIGTHRVDFSRKGDTLTATTKVEIIVQIAFIVVYRYNQTKIETWQDGTLQRLDVSTNDNGDEARIRVSRAESATDGGALVAHLADKVLRHPGSLVPSTYWRAETIRQSALLDSTEGTLLRISVRRGTEDHVATKAADIRGHHYIISGELARDVWYSPAGRWVGLRLTARDGSVITYVPK